MVKEESEGKGAVCWLLFYAIATIGQLCYDGDMMYEMRRRKPEHTLLATRAFVPLIPHRHGMKGTGLVWQGKVYTVGKWITAQLNVMAVMGFVPLSPASPSLSLN